MKSLYESILSTTKTGGYAEGKHIEVDGIPCTVVKNDGEYAWVLSDIFTGTNAGKISFKSNDSLDWSNSAYYEWGHYGCNKEYFPKGWSYPNAEEWVKFDKELHDYVMNDCHMIPAYMVWMKKGRKLFPYDMSTHILYHDDRHAGIRFAKKIKL